MNWSLMDTISDYNEPNQAYNTAGLRTVPAHWLIYCDGIILMISYASLSLNDWSPLNDHRVDISRPCLNYEPDVHGFTSDLSTIIHIRKKKSLSQIQCIAIVTWPFGGKLWGCLLWVKIKKMSVRNFCFSLCSTVYNVVFYWWLSARLQYLHC